jgi:hypothetical protein
MTDFEVEEMASGVEVSGVQARPRRTHAVAVRSRRDSESVARLGDSPWRRRDLIKLTALHIIGLVVIVIGWIGSSGQLDFADQTRWTALAVFGAVLAAIGGASWLLAGLATVSRERRLLRDQIGVLYAPEAAQSVADGAAGTFVSADGMRRYHLPSCDVVRGKATRPVIGPRHEDLSPCGMCKS